MRRFFRSTRFKVLLSITGVLIIIMIVASTITGWIAPQSNIVGAVITPVQRLVAGVGNSVAGFFAGFGADQALQEENEALKEELREKTEKLIDYDKIKQQNEFYKDFLDIKEKHPDFSFVPAMRTADDPMDQYGSFTIDKGTADGISHKDPVITADGLVGYIYEAGINFSTVVTLLNPEVQVGAYDSRTRDAGVAEGSWTLAEQGQFRLSYLKRSTEIAQGDYIVTSGIGGMFPEGLLLGTVTELGQDEGSVSVYAVIEPAVDFDAITDVMVINDFDGNGNTSSQEDTN